MERIITSCQKEPACIKDGIQIDGVTLYHKNGFVPLGKQCGTYWQEEDSDLPLPGTAWDSVQTFQKVCKLCAELFGSRNTDTSQK